MLKLKHLLAILGLSLVYGIPSAGAIERSGGGNNVSEIAKVDVKIETIRTFIDSVINRLEIDIDKELGYDAGGRIYNQLIVLQGRLAAVEERFNNLPRDKFRGVEQDSTACLMAKDAIDPGCDPNIRRMIWQYPNNGQPPSWKCVDKAPWELPVP